MVDMGMDMFWMERALIQAKRAASIGEVPVGGLLVHNNRLIASGHNQSIQDHDPSAHAEVVILRKAGQVIENYRFVDMTLYVTLEPCIMCTGVLIHARIKRLVFGATDPKAGAICSICKLLEHPKLNHQIEVTPGILSDACGCLLSDFFKSRRKSHFRLDRTLEKQ